MPYQIFQTPQYKQLIQEHIIKTIEYLFSQNKEFALACRVKNIGFNPELPSEILDSFEETVLFVLSGYTFESASIDKAYFTFEAGFGPDNFGSTLSVPIMDIQQVFVGDNPLVFNWGEYEEKKVHDAPLKNTSVDTSSSMEALLSNPENQKLLKKHKP